MDSKSLEMLEFGRVREILTGFTSFSASREMALALQPSSDFKKVSLLLKQSAEARLLLSTDLDFSIGKIADIRQAAHTANLGKVLELATLVEIQDTLASIRQLHGALGRRSKELPLLWQIAKGLTPMPQIEKEIAGCLTPNAEILDSASPKLASVRRRLRELRQHLLDRLEAIMKSPKGQRITQEPIITDREGRYVIPVKVEHRKEIKGIVHDVSNTGSTLFVEPWATMEMGNELRELVMEEKHEIERILGELSANIGHNYTPISNNISLVAELDMAMAKAKYARRARAAEPVLTGFDRKSGNDSVGILKLVNARHPLLGDKAVPLSIELGRDYSILIITGPNMGGKTVALKTLGLLSLMAQAGMPIPAAPESIVPVFDGIFADIGDEQSIEQTMSTFSWHMSNIVRIIDRASAKSLVLLDELGTSTDPAEGSALARSILNYLLSHRTTTVATTHYNDLKVYAHVTRGLQNASLDFDSTTRMPTYHLTLGLPGGSNALAIAAHLGLPPEIIEGARQMMTKGTQELETLLADLSTEKQRFDTLTTELQKEKEVSSRLSSELEQRLQSLKEEESVILQDARDRIVSEAAELQREIRKALAELRRNKRKEAIDQARNALTAMQNKLKTDAWQPKPATSPDGETDQTPISAGDTVRVKEANLIAQVLSILPESQQVEVQAGRARLTLGMDSVEKVSRAAAPNPVYSTVQVPKRNVPFELDLRGKRAEEIEPMVDSYLNNASLASLSEVRIIHGFGTGVVRQIVRELLASHPLVKTFRPGERGEGGDGATVVKL